ncbi:MAG: HEAT repeat domain-containing protein [Phycisphaerae bacterium]|nr:HEAT repeat domain-containing protein [Phycisphaerae bacterium]MCZ2398975.1 HEAT repeat domain-containing protein [Phycisphaerae bacterium]
MRRLPDAAVRAALAVAAALAAAGCTEPRKMTLTPVEREQLSVRALDLLLRAARSDIDIVRCNAMEALVELAPRPALAEFRAAAQAQEPPVRFAAFVALGKVRDAGAAALIDLGLRDPEPRVRLAAAFAAARLGGQNAAGVLVSALNEDRNVYHRADAAFLLGELGEPKAIPWLERAARLEDSHRVKVHIYAALAALGDRSAVGALLAFLRVDTESRLIALQSLARLGHPDARDTLLYELMDANEFLESRLIAARGLGVLGSRAGYALAAGNVHATFKDQQDVNRTFRIRSLSALALGDIGDGEALPLLHWLAANDTDERTQVAAAYAICKITRGGGEVSAGSY